MFSGSPGRGEPGTAQGLLSTQFLFPAKVGGAEGQQDDLPGASEREQVCCHLPAVKPRSSVPSPVNGEQTKPCWPATMPAPLLGPGRLGPRGPCPPPPWDSQWNWAKKGSREEICAFEEEWCRMRGWGGDRQTAGGLGRRGSGGQPSLVPLPADPGSPAQSLHNHPAARHSPGSLRKFPLSPS